MDELVKAALKKWPHVPDCYGWLALDARGDWYMRDDRVRAAGPFPAIKGSRILHEKLREFIERNYAADAAGRWYFQNGPQRVYVELEAAPYVWRLHEDVAGCVVRTPDGRAAAVQGAWTDEAGRLYLLTEHGYGLVHSLDMLIAAEAVERGDWVVESMPAAAMPETFGFVKCPQPDPKP